VWFRIRLDLGAREVAAGAAACAFARDAEAAAARCEARWSGPHGALACLSVRSGLDLLLGVLALPEGSEVLMSALTIPDVARVVRAHGLVPVPVDLDPRDGRVDPVSLARCLGPRTRLLLVAHLFGDVMPLDELVAALPDEVLLVEDCAQAYGGPGGYSGDPRADVVLFSFGAIKTATALGGALLCARDPELLTAMRARQAVWPLQSRASFAKRLASHAVLALATRRLGYTVVGALARAAGQDLDALLLRTARGFAGPELLASLRRRPSAPLLRLLARRLAEDPPRAIRGRRRHGLRLAERLGVRVDGGVAVLPSDLERHVFWLFPLRVDDPESWRARLREEGFDSSAGHSLSVVSIAEGRGENAGAQSLLEGLLFVPAYAQLSEAEVERLADSLLELAAATQSTSAPCGR